MDKQKKANQKMKLALLLFLVAAAVVCVVFLYFLLRPNRWTVTQYASNADEQAMIYTITDQKGHFVIVDGGLDADAEMVRQMIAQHKDHVDTWIITHTHKDHVGAFNAIMDGTANDFQIDHIYTVDYNTERYKETAHDYDRFDVHETFERFAADLPQIEYLHENDELDLIGLHMKVLSAWDEKVDAMEDHLCNDGSMMFRIDGKKDSMLFCADVQEEMEQYILPTHEEDIQTDYVQCGHHGNWGLSTDFYDRINPKAVFMDAPAWLFDAENEKFDGYRLKQYFMDRGIEVYTHEGAPHTVTLE